MNNRLTSMLNGVGQGPVDFAAMTPQTELRYVKHALGGMVQDALKVWGDLWGEFQGRVVSGVTVLPEAQEGFRPECGWPEFLEKMWQLRFYLASAKKFCDQRP